MKKILWILPAILLFVTMGVLALNTVTLVSPASGAVANNASGTAILNASFATPALNYTVCTFHIDSQLSNATTYVQILNISGDTQKTGMSTNASINTTFNTKMFQDASDIRMYTTCNTTNDTFATSTVVTGIIINNTVPIAPTAITPATKTMDTDGSVTFAGTGLIDENTTACTLNLYVGATKIESHAMTYSTTSCSLTRSINDGSYYWTITASDGLDTREGNRNELNVNIDKEYHPIPAEVYQEAVKTSISSTQTEQKKLDIKTIAIILVIMFGLWYIIKKK